MVKLRESCDICCLCMCTVLYCTVLYCTVLYCILMYCVLCCTAFDCFRLYTPDFFCTEVFIPHPKLRNLCLSEISVYQELRIEVEDWIRGCVNILLISILVCTLIKGRHLLGFVFNHFILDLVQISNIFPLTFIICGFSIKWLAHFFFKTIEEMFRINMFQDEKSVIYHVFNQIMYYRVPLWIGNAPRFKCMHNKFVFITIWK